MDNSSESPIIQYIKNVRDWGLEYASRRYYGLYKGVVVSNLDEGQQGKVTLCVGDLGFGFLAPTGVFIPDTIRLQAYPGTLYAGLDHGVYFPPEEGDTVWVSFDHGDPSQPRYHGSWWCSDDAGATPVGSHLPQEFKSDLIRPFKRGIKSKRGHGFLFNDLVTESGIEIWTGEQLVPHEAARRKHQILMSDNPANSFVRVITNDGRVIELNDTEQKITISGASVVPEGEPPDAAISNSVVIDDLLNTLTVKSKLQQKIEINDTISTTTVDTPGTLLVGAVGGIAVSSGAAAVAPPLPGAITETGVGAKIINFAGAITETIGGIVTRTVVGAVTETFAGAVTQTVGGALTQTVAGVWSMISPNATFTPNSAFIATTDQSHPVIPAVTLGSAGGLKLLLVQESFIDAYNTHTHTSGAPGAPTSPPIEQIVPPTNLLSTPPDPSVVAPNIDKRTVLTEYVWAD